MGGYTLINEFSVGTQAASLLLPGEETIPFIPLFIIPYLSAFIIGLAPYFFVKDTKQFRKVVLSYLAVTVTAFAVFLSFPVHTPRPEFVSSNIFEWLVQLVYSLDQPYNSFPSLHVVTPILAGLIVYGYNKKWGTGILLWSVLITLSIVFIKQHYILDAVGGVLVALAGFVLFRSLMK